LRQRSRACWFTHLSKNTRALDTSSSRRMDSSSAPSLHGSGLRSNSWYSRLRDPSYHGGLSDKSQSNMSWDMYDDVNSAPNAASRTREVFLLASWLAQNREWPAASSARRRAAGLVRGSMGDNRVEYWRGTERGRLQCNFQCTIMGREMRALGRSTADGWLWQSPLSQEHV
jgi:hypothetical protein